MKKFTQWVDVIREAEERQQSELQKSYKDYFSAKLNKFNAKSPADLTEEQKKEFFNEIKKDWEIGTGAKPAGKKDIEDHGVKESVEFEMNESAFYRLPRKMIQNELWLTTKNVQNFFNNASAGSDVDPGVLDSIIKSLGNIKKELKKFTNAEDVKGSVYESVVNEANQEEQIKKEVISKLSDFFRVSPGNLSKFKFDGNDNIKELTKALGSTSDAGTEQYYRVAIQVAKRDLGIDESEEVNESAIEIAGGIILGIVGLKVIGGIAKGLFGTLKLKAMKDPEKLKELAKEIASRAMEKNPLKAALWLTAVKGMIDKGDIKDGFGLLKTAAKMDSMDIKKVFEAEGFDFSGDVNEANISMYKSMVQNVLKDLDVEVKQADLKVGTKKSDSWSFVTLNGHVLCSDTAYDQMVAWAKAAIKEDPAKYGLPTSLKESELFEADVKNAKDFEEYAMAILKKQHGDDFDEAKAKKTISGLSAAAEKDGDWGAAVGKLQNA